MSRVTKKKSQDEVDMLEHITNLSTKSEENIDSEILARIMPPLQKNSVHSQSSSSVSQSMIGPPTPEQVAHMEMYREQAVIGQLKYQYYADRTNLINIFTVLGSIIISFIINIIGVIVDAQDCTLDIVKNLKITTQILQQFSLLIAGGGVAAKYHKKSDRAYMCVNALEDLEKAISIALLRVQSRGEMNRYIMAIERERVNIRKNYPPLPRWVDERFEKQSSNKIDHLIRTVMKSRKKTRLNHFSQQQTSFSDIERSMAAVVIQTWWRKLQLAQKVRHQQNKLNSLQTVAQSFNLHSHGKSTSLTDLRNINPAYQKICPSRDANKRMYQMYLNAKQNESSEC